MNGKDRNEKKIEAADIRKHSENRIRNLAKEKPSEKARKWFERKTYTKW